MSKISVLAILIAFTSFLPNTSWGQAGVTFTGTKTDLAVPGLTNTIATWKAFSFDVNAIREEINAQSQFAHITMQFEDQIFDLNLQPSYILSPNYRLEIRNGDQTTLVQQNDIVTLQGFVGGNLGGQVRLTLSQDYLSGFIEYDHERYYIEPGKSFLPGTSTDVLMFYKKSDVNHDTDASCIAIETAEYMQMHGHEQEETPAGDAEFLACYNLDLAIASDDQMFSKYGNVAAVQAHNVTVINNVEGDYTGNFNHDLNFVIVANVVYSANDPWSATLDAVTLLGEFASWGNAGNFGVAFDEAELWTNRDFTGSTVGIAYLNGICNSNKYHCLQDFTSDQELLRCMTSHEMGHNWSCGHDTGAGQCPPNYIMCPFVSTSTTWSSNSVTSVNNYMASKIGGTCLTPCSSGPPPVAQFSWNPTTPCKNTPVQFTDNSTNIPTSWSWTFQGGSPATSTQQNPVVTWATAGTFNVTLTATNASGSNQLVQQITVIQAPTSANYTFTVNDLTVTFNGTAPGATSYSWNFGDGNFSTEEDPEHTYNEAGTYTVIFTATNDCGSTSKTLVITTAPTAEFSATPTSGCATLFVNYSNESSTNASTYQWTFQGGSPATSSLANPVVAYTTSGTYSVTLTSSNANGSSTIIKTNYITVQPLPLSNFTFSANGLTVTFTNTSTNGTSYLWDFGDGFTSTEVNPVHTYAVGGNYTVTLTTTNACGNLSNTKTVNLTPPPTASFQASPTAGCAPLTVQFTSTSTGTPTGYAWTFAGGNPATSNLPNPSVVFASPGNYGVTLTVTNAGGSNTYTQNNFIQVNTTPTPGFTSNINGTTASFTNSSSNASGYSWNFGDGGTSTASDPVHTYAGDGTYTVTLTATNACGNSVITQTVTIVTPPTANFTFSPSAGCAPLTVQYTSTSSANTTSYNWQFPGGNPSSSTVANPVVVYASPGAYSATLTATNASGNNTTTQTNIINAGAAPGAGFNNTLNGYTASFVNTSTNATSYAWNFGDGGTSNAQNPTHTYASDGTYTVTMTATNACGSTVYTQIIVINTPPTAGFSASQTTGCEPLTVQFTSTSSANVTGYQWTFAGGNPASSTAQNPTVTYSNAGTYGVTLTVSNATGTATAIQNSYVNVGTAPFVGFISSLTGNAATFTNTTVNGTSYSWNFGDGVTSSETNPVHNYTSDGTYTVVLTATNGCGTSTATQTVTLVTPPTASFNFTPSTGCVPMTVQYSNTSSANATSFAWQFPGGDPSTSTLANPVVTYNATGTYSATLVASNIAGSSTYTQTNVIVVITTPNAGFVSAINGTTVNFTNTTTGAFSFSWDFGDGTTGTAPNPSHTYANDGVYTVVLTATNGCGTATSFQQVTIITPPTAGFTAGDRIGCAPLTVHFQNNASSNATSWNWTFPGGNPATSTVQNPVVVYANPGVYTVILEVANAAGNSTSTETNFVTVNTVPTAQFTSNGNLNTFAFTNNSTGATSYLWDFGDGSTSTEVNPTHNYAADGVYTVTLTATNDCGSVVQTSTVTVVTLPTSAFTSSGTTGCAPLTVTFSNQSSANTTSVLWLFDGGTPSSSTDNNPTVIWNNPGNYVVTLIATNAAGSASSNSSVAVNTVPTADFTPMLGGLSVSCMNNSIGATQYLWNFGDGNTSTEVNPTHTYAAVGNYIITLKAINDCGSTDFTSQVEIQGSAPLPSFTVSQTNGCIPFTVNYFDNSLGNPTSWQWEFPGGTPPFSNAQNPTVVYNTPGLFSATLTATNIYGTASVTESEFITVGQAPSADFTFAANLGTVVFNSTTINATSYGWDFGDGATSTEANPTHTYSQSGTYTVTLTVSNECGAVTIQKQVTVTTVSVDIPEWVDGFTVFPNPNDGRFTVEMKGKSNDPIRFELFNSIGQRIYQRMEDLKSGNLTSIFELSGLPAAVYHLRVSSGESQFTVTITVQ